MRFTFVAAAYHPSTASLGRFCAPGPAKRGRAFYFAIQILTFYEIISKVFFWIR
ncbi:MAG: hypothetical protein NTY64_02780 [Deltaproteobacteria bacterium]|nr:hypothetical protein [Deltaproteobacteria bacterium]